jgi:high affinity Mn2+ porin
MRPAFRIIAGVAILAGLAPMAPACAQQVPAPIAPAPAAPDTPPFAIHAQSTFTAQGTPGFSAPYSGANSLTPSQVKETFDATLFLGARLWRGAEVWVNPEIDQGFGLSNTLGVAGFPSGEAYKVGKSNPYFRLQRAFVRQTVNLGGESSKVAADANVMAGTQSANRLVITLGKFGVGDVFDTNAYAHDPRGDFLNWSIIDTGSFDYAADAWGYSVGASAEWYQGDWTLRAGLFNLSKVPNGEVLQTDLSQFEIDGEIEHRHNLHGHPGAIRLAFFRNHGRFERLADAIAAYDATGMMPDPASLRRPATHWGGQLNAEQEVSGALGLFLRAGLGGGSLETDEFTDIDRSVAVGGRLKGQGWGRGDDSIGFAFVDNGISKERQLFLADGGLGLLVGDGQLPHPGDERIVESFYDWQLAPHVNLTADYQFVSNPGYNRDRGPAHVFALRAHLGI